MSDALSCSKRGEVSELTIVWDTESTADLGNIDKLTLTYFHFYDFFLQFQLLNAFLSLASIRFKVEMSLPAVVMFHLL